MSDGSVDPSTKGRLLQEPAVDAMNSVTTRRLTVRLYHLELVPEYREFVECVVGTIKRVEVSGGAFCAGPRAVVPVHVDRYDNLLLQIAGRKRIEVGRFSDPVRQQAAIDRDLGASVGEPKVLPPPILTTELGPGDGVFVPGYTFHWTQNGDEPSVSVSVAWSTPAMVEVGRVHRYNRHLRRLRMRPAPVGTRPTADHAKAVVIRVLERARDRDAAGTARSDRRRR